MDTDVKKLAAAITKLAEVHDRRLGEVSESLNYIARQITQLGNGNAATEMGGLEGLGKSVVDGLSTLSDSISSAADKIAEAKSERGE